MINKINTQNTNVNYGALRITGKNATAKNCLKTIYTDAGDFFDTHIKKKMVGKQLFIEARHIHPELARQAEVNLFSYLAARCDTCKPISCSKLGIDILDRKGPAKNLLATVFKDK